MRIEPSLILQVPRDGGAARRLRADPPMSVANGHVVVEHFPLDDGGRLEAPEAGEVILSVLSPEALRREPQRVRDAVRQAADSDQPPVLIVEAAEELREDELAVVLDAADRAHRIVIMRVMENA
jgi:hypothetical protein